MEIEVPNVDLTTVETGIPLLADGLYEVRVEEMTVAPTKNGDSNMLNIKLSLEQSATTTGGESVSPGFPIYDRIWLGTTDKYTPAKRLASLMDGFLGARSPKLNTEDFIGKTGVVRLKIRRDETYGESNEVKAYEPKK
jgi:hypothetical protein